MPEGRGARADPSSIGPSAPVRVDPASFRDPDGRVYHDGDRVLRAVNEQGAEHVRALERSGLLDALVARRALVGTRLLDPAGEPETYERIPGAALILEHERLDFISYAYEWPFELLRAAALQYLETMELALDYGFILKDATTYNSQFIGASPVQIDVSSFEPYRPGAPWQAYAQFCRMFLAPLLLQSLTGVRFQPWLRGSLDGIAPADLNRVLKLRHRFRRDVLLHVVAQSWLNRAASDSLREVEGQQVSEATVRRLVRSLRGAVERLRRPSAGRSDSHWVDYEAQCHYDADAAAAKRAFVERFVRDAAPDMLWDLGCNTGEYSRITAAHAKTVVALDGDDESVGRLARSAPDNVLPLVMDLANPSPGQGWGQAERMGLRERGPADAVLCLALVHHLAISGNVPLPAFVAWLAEHAGSGVVEFVPLSDPMARRLLATQPAPPEYGEREFEDALRQCFNIDQVTRLPNSERVLYAFSR